MTGSILTELLLPIALAFIMLGMGLGLTTHDFMRLWQTPKSVLAGVAGQLLLMPLLALALGISFGLSAPLAMGVMVLAACPGGSMSNVLSHLAKANLALSVSLTAIGTLACIITAPFIIYLSSVYFVKQADVQYSLMSISVKLLFFTLLPIIFGMVIRHFYREWAIRREVFFRRFSLTFLVLLVIGVVVQEFSTLQRSFNDAFMVCITLNLLSILLGLLLAKFLQLSHKDALTLAIEIGVQNSTMAILVALTIMQMPSYAIVAGVYGITMYLGVGLLMLYSKYVVYGQQVPLKS